MLRLSEVISEIHGCAAYLMKMVSCSEASNIFGMQ